MFMTFTIASMNILFIILFWIPFWNSGFTFLNKNLKYGTAFFVVYD